MSLSPRIRRLRAGLLAVALLSGVGYLVFGVPKPSGSPLAGTSEPEPEAPAAKPFTTGSLQPLPISPAENDSATLPGCATPAAEIDIAPTADGWDTEVCSEAAGSQLKKIAALVTRAGPIDAEALAPMVADRFQCEPLVPAGLIEAHRDKTFAVSRSKEDVKPELSHHGASGLAEALGQLAALYRGSKDIHSKFKVFRVEKQETQIVTSAYFQSGGPTPGGSVQVGATWTCEWIADNAKAAAPKLRSIRVTDYEQTIAALPAGRMFADCTDAILGANSSYQDQLRYGVDHWLGRIETMKVRHGLDVGGWEGLAVGDVNGDGLDDLYVCQPGPLTNRLYVQMQDGTAHDVSSIAGVDILNQTTAALFADFDNDGDQDLAVATELGILLLANDGDGSFLERPAPPTEPGRPIDRRLRPAVRAAKFLPDSSAYSLAAADYDADGDLDLFVCGYGKRPGPGERQEGWARPVPYHDAENGGRNTLLRNDGPQENGHWKFAYATVESGFDENNRKFSYAASWEDFDNDGDLDLHVANDFGRDNLYQNDGRGHFRDIAAAAGADDIGAGMSSAWGDYDNDGWMDLYISNMFSSAGNRVAFHSRFQPTLDPALRASYQHHARGNSLLRNRGDGTFEDVSVPLAVTVARWAWASKLADINNDGWEDILVTNGFVTQEDPADL